MAQRRQPHAITNAATWFYETVVTVKNLSHSADDPNLRADAQKEIDSTVGGTAYGKPAKAAPVAAAPAAATNPFTALADELEGSGKSAQPKTIQARAPVAEAPIAGQEEPGVLDRVAGAVKGAMPGSVAEFFDPMRTHKAAAEVLANQASGLGTAIVGGWAGLTALAKGKGLDEG